MGGQGSGRKPDPVKQLTQKLTPIASKDNEGMFLPNFSGMQSHNEFNHTHVEADITDLQDYVIDGGDTITGNYTITTGNLTLTSGNLTLTSGDLTLTSGDLTLSNGTLYLALDNLQTIYGTGNDASIYYDGTNLIIDPDLVGSGRLIIDGSLNIDDKANNLHLGLGTQGDSNIYCYKNYIETWQSTSSSTHTVTAYTLSADEAVLVKAKIVGITTNGSASYMAEQARLIRKDGAAAAVTVGLIQSLYIISSELGATINITTSSNNAIVTVASTASAQTINWTVYVEVVSAS